MSAFSKSGKSSLVQVAKDTLARFTHHGHARNQPDEVLQYLEGPDSADKVAKEANLPLLRLIQNGLLSLKEKAEKFLGFLDAVTNRIKELEERAQKEEAEKKKKLLGGAAAAVLTTDVDTAEAKQFGKWLNGLKKEERDQVVCWIADGEKAVIPPGPTGATFKLFRERLSPDAVSRMVLENIIQTPMPSDKPTSAQKKSSSTSVISVASDSEEEKEEEERPKKKNKLNDGKDGKSPKVARGASNSSTVRKEVPNPDPKHYASKNPAQTPSAKGQPSKKQKKKSEPKTRKKDESDEEDESGSDDEPSDNSEGEDEEEDAKDSGSDDESSEKPEEDDEDEDDEEEEEEEEEENPKTKKGEKEKSQKSKARAKDSQASQEHGEEEILDSEVSHVQAGDQGKKKGGNKAPPPMDDNLRHNKGLLKPFATTLVQMAEDDKHPQHKFARRLLERIMTTTASWNKVTGNKANWTFGRECFSDATRKRCTEQVTKKLQDLMSSESDRAKKSRWGRSIKDMLEIIQTRKDASVQDTQMFVCRLLGVLQGLQGGFHASKIDLHDVQRYQEPLVKEKYDFQRGLIGILSEFFEGNQESPLNVPRAAPPGKDPHTTKPFGKVTTYFPSTVKKIESKDS
jgi:hypothetical protein